MNGCDGVRVHGLRSILFLVQKRRAFSTVAILRTRDDIRAMVGPVLRHRIVTNFTAEADGVTSIQIIEKLLEEHGYKI